MTDNPPSDQPSSDDARATDEPGPAQSGDSTAHSDGSPDEERPPGARDERVGSGEESKSSGCLAACLGGFAAVGVLVVLLGVGVYFAWGYITNFAINQVTQVAEQRIENSDFTDEQKTKIKKQFEAVKTRFQNGDLSMEEVEAVVQHTEPLLMAMSVQAVKQTYITPSDWPDQVKNDAQRTLDRFTRGLQEGEIDRDTFSTVMEPVTDSDGNDERIDMKHKRDPSGDALKELVKRAKKQVEQHDIPDEPYDFDVVSAFEQVLEQARNDTENGASTY